MNTKEIAKCYVTKIESSKRRGKEFNLSFTAFANIKQQTHCEYSGLPFDDMNTMSFERIDNSIGYVDGNVIPVIQRLNVLRGDKTLEECTKLLESMIKGNTCQKYNYNVIISQKVYDVKATNKPKLKGRAIKSYFSQVQTLEKIYSNMIAHTDYYKETINVCCSKGNSPLKTIKILEKLLEKDKEKFNNKHTELKNWLSKMKKCNAKYNKYEYQLAYEQKTVWSIKQNSTSESDIQDMKYVIQGLTKFANLSKSQKYAVKLGLPTNTSKLNLLKHKVVYNFINKV